MNIICCETTMNCADPVYIDAANNEHFFDWIVRTPVYQAILADLKADKLPCGLGDADAILSYAGHLVSGLFREWWQHCKKKGIRQTFLVNSTDPECQFSWLCCISEDGRSAVCGLIERKD